MKNFISSFNEKFMKVFITIYIVISSIVPVYATDIKSSILYTGTIRLIKDATSVLNILLPLVCIVLVLFFQFRKSFCDEHEQQMWQKRTIGAIIALVVGICANTLISIVINYYGGAAV